MATTPRTALLLVSGLIVTAVVCNAQEAVQADNQKPAVVLVPATLAPPAVDPWLETVEKRPAKQVAETPWYWRFMEGMAIGAATYNTRKQSDGRPQTPSTVKP